MGVGLDGANLYIRQEGWKELKVGCVFLAALRPIFEPETREWLEQGHAVNNNYIAYLGGPEEFGQRWWATAQQRGWEQHYETQAIRDGYPIGSGMVESEAKQLRLGFVVPACAGAARTPNVSSRFGRRL
jgi:hypothetical protein